MTEPGGWSEDREIAKDLIDHWLTKLTINLPDDYNVNRLSGVWGWAQHCHHVGLHFIQITDVTPWWEPSGSLVRLCFELGVKAQWLSQVDDALKSEIFQNEELRQKKFNTYLKAMTELDLEPHETMTQDVIDGFKVDTPDRVYGDFYQICQMFGFQDYLYLTYQTLCNFAHANAMVPNDYIKVFEGTYELDKLQSHPPETSAANKMMFMHALAQSLVWSQAAVLNFLPGTESEMARVMERSDKVGTPALIPLKPPRVKKRRHDKSN